MSRRLGVFVTHPIQYQVQLWRQLAACPEIELEVNYFDDHGVGGEIDREFGVPVTWDVPLLEGYSHRFLMKGGDLYDYSSLKMDNAAKFLRERQYDSIFLHGYMYKFERQLVRAAKSLGVPVTLRAELHEGRPRSLLRAAARHLYLKWFYCHVNRFAVIGEIARQHLYKYGVRDDQMVSIPYCVDSQRFENQYDSLERDKCRAELQIEADEFVILFSGKLIPRKNPMLIVEAARQLKSETRVHFIMMGDGALMPELKRATTNLSGCRFMFPGFINQSSMAKYFRASDALVLPSHFETWGLVVNEAMHMRLPVLVSDQVGCHHDLVKDDVNGYVFPSDNAADLARAIDRLASDRDSALQMGQTSFQRVQAYSTRSAVEGLVQAAA